ncbi:MAG TPA: flippase [bacterium]|nr:flippase [bacterium]
MRRSVRLIRNTYFLSVARVTNPFLAMVLVLVLSRQTGAQGLGEYTTVLTLFSFFTTFSALGLHGPIVRDVAARPSSVGRILSGGYLLGGISALIFSMIMAGTAVLLKYESAILYGVMILAPALICYTISLITQALLQGVERMEYTAVILISETLIKVILGITVLVLRGPIIAVIGAVAVSHLISMILGLILVHRGAGPIRWELNRESFFDLFRQIPTFFALSIVVMVYWNTDILMLSKMQGTVSVGLYSAAYRLLSIGKELANSYIVAIFPVISHFYLQSRESFQISCIRSIKYLLIFSLPVAVAVTLRAREILLLLYGQAEFSGGESTLQVLIWTMVFFPIANILGNGLIASHRQRIDLWVNTMGAVFNVCLNLVLIPRFGPFGAGVATLLSIVFFLLVQNFYVSRVLFRIPFWDVFFRPALSAVVMGLVICLPVSLFIVVPSGLIVYGLCLWLLRSFSSEEIEMIRILWRQRNQIFQWRNS